jgi:hypothetical protein
MTPDSKDTDLSQLEVARNYAVILVVGAMISWGARTVAGLDAVRTMLAYLGTLFVLASVRRPKKLFLTFRSLAEFPLFPALAAQVLFAILGICAIVTAVAGP